jgi:hypothetical protein
MRLVALAFLFVVGCNTWQPDEFPVPVVVLSETSSFERATMRAWAEEWNARTGREVFRLRFDPDGLSDCGQVNVWVVDHKPNGRDGWITVDECSARVHVRSHAQFGRTFAHELGHLLLDTDWHSEDPGSVMHDPITPDSAITDDDVELMLGAMGR